MGAEVNFFRRGWLKSLQDALAGAKKVSAATAVRVRRPLAKKSTAIQRGETENAGMENAGLENEGPNRKGGKRTRILRSP